jgi:taurine dioxygenase
MGLQIRRLSYALGAEIIRDDFPKPLGDSGFRDIQRAFLEYLVLLFRGQFHTQEQQVAFTRRFGEVNKNDDLPHMRHPEYPEILFVSNKNKKPKPNAKPKLTDKYAAGMVWHSDRSFTCRPVMASLLRGVEIPDVGGDTMFSNQYLAYETLSDGMKRLIEGLDGVHIGGEDRLDLPPTAQPLVRVHPETGRKALYVSERIQHIVGMSAEESKPLIQFLCNHATRPQFVYRHQWRKNDLLMWDNRCLSHIALGDYDRTQVRHMEKTTVIGTPSGYVYEGPLQ